MFVPVTAPRSNLGVPSPKSTVTSWMTVRVPVGGATDAVNKMSVPAVGCVVVAVMDTAGCGFALTTTDVEAGTELPNASVTVARIVYVPGDRYVWETTVLAVIAPRC